MQVKESPRTYRVSEVAKIAGVSSSTLRLWETHGLLSPSRTEGEHRILDERDLERVRRIAMLRKDRGLNLAAIRSIFEDTRLANVRPNELPEGEVTIGRRLKELRLRNGFTLKHVESTTGLKSSYLSNIERTAQAISTENLIALARCYGVPSNELQSLTHQATYAQPETRGAEFPVKVEQLSDGPIRMARWTVEAGAASQSVPASDGDEFLHVLSGTFEIETGAGAIHRLKSGDSLRIPGEAVTAWRNSGSHPTVVMWIGTPRP